MEKIEHRYGFVIYEYFEVEMLYFCCGMRRSGSTLQFNLVKELLFKKHGYVENEEQLVVLLENQPRNGNLVIKCHEYMSYVENLIRNKKAIAFYIYRDVRDVVVSLINMYDSTFLNVIKNRFHEKILNEYYLWTRVDKIIVSIYENIMKDIQKEINRYAHIMNVDLDDLYGKCIAEKLSIENQKKKIEKFDFKKDGIHTGVDFIDPESQLHSKHINRGKIGLWRIELSCIEIAYIEELALDWLKINNYKISHPWLYRKIALRKFSQD